MGDYMARVRIWKRTGQLLDFNISMQPYRSLEDLRNFLRPRVDENRIQVRFWTFNGEPLTYYNDDQLGEIETLELFLHTFSLEVAPEPLPDPPAPNDPPLNLLAAHILYFQEFFREVYVNASTFATLEDIRVFMRPFLYHLQEEGQLIQLEFLTHGGMIFQYNNNDVIHQFQLQNLFSQTILFNVFRPPVADPPVVDPPVVDPPVVDPPVVDPPAAADEEEVLTPSPRSEVLTPSPRSTSGSDSNSNSSQGESLTGDAPRVLDIILRQQAAQRCQFFFVRDCQFLFSWGCFLVRQSFFHDDVKSFVDVGGGVTACRGFHTTQSGLSLNMDVSSTMILTPGHVLELLINQNVRDPRHIDWLRAKKMLKNLRIKTRHNKMGFKIIGLGDQPCNKQYFPMKIRNGNGEEQPVEVTVYDYFTRHKNIELSHSAFMPCLDVGKPKRPKYLPLEELCSISTQCISPTRINDLTNVLLKINTKLGGVNSLLAVESAPSIPLISRNPTMIVGMDVSRGSPGHSDIPSIAAVVGSRAWPYISRYRAAVRTQSPKVEMIDSLFKVLPNGQDDGIMRELLVNFFQSTNERKPTQMIIFRDGIGESQFNQVLNIELEQIIKALKHLGETDLPKFTVIVAQKNHHTKLFQAGGRPENVPPGTVVDTKVLHPRNYDFYMCAQAGMIGTSRPAHYHVLLDEIGFTADDLQKLVHSLSYVYQRSTTAISIVAPLCYAHHAASQVGQFIKFDDFSETSSGDRAITSAGPVPGSSMCCC